MAMPLLITGVGPPPVPANLLAIAGAGLANFYLAATVAFVRMTRRPVMIRA